MIPKKVAIIGGGASGLFCAIFCAKAGLHVTLFEQNDKCAKKILVSGNGRCNITNKNLHASDFFSQNPNFVEYALKNFGFQAFEKFTTSIGLLLHVLDDGRAYPLSHEAKSVARIFEEYAKELGVVFRTQEKITDIKKLTQKYESVVVASGSRAAPHLGGNADAEEFAKVFGHTVIEAYPSLVQLHLTSKTAHKMSGAKCHGEVTLLVNHQKEAIISSLLEYPCSLYDHIYTMQRDIATDIEDSESFTISAHLFFDNTLFIDSEWDTDKFIFVNSIHL